jgi:hypothetical protein
VSQFRPVYVDGPLEGEEFSLPDDFPVVYAHDADGTSVLETRNQVAYQFLPFVFTMGGKAVRVQLGYCGDYPDADAVAKALFRPEVFERTEVINLPPDLTA